MVKRYKNKPVEIEAIQFTDDNYKEVEEFVGQALQDNNIEYYTVYSSKNMLNEWVGRMYIRGNDSEFIDKQIEMWDKNVGNIDNEPHGKFIYRLNANGSYIGSIVEDIIEDNNLY